MSKASGQYAALHDALRAMGIEPDNTSRVIIDIDSRRGGPPKVYVQQVATDALPVALLALAEMRVTVVDLDTATGMVSMAERGPTSPPRP